MPGPEEERRRLARSKFYSCPHRTLTSLEIYLCIDAAGRSEPASADTEDTRAA